MGVKQTSMLAFERAKAQIGAQQARVLAVIKNPMFLIEGGITRQEIARSTGLRINVVCPRVKELLNGGHIKIVGERPCTITGHAAELLGAVL